MRTSPVAKPAPHRHDHALSPCMPFETWLICQVCRRRFEIRVDVTPGWQSVAHSRSSGRFFAHRGVAFGKVSRFAYDDLDDDPRRRRRVVVYEERIMGRSGVAFLLGGFTVACFAAT